MTTQYIGRRSVLAGAVALAAAAALPRVARAQKRDFIVATYGGLFEKVLRAQVVPAFEKKHDVTVKLELGVGSTFIPKIISSPRRSPYDVVYVNDDEAVLGQDAGLWAPDQSPKLHNIGDIYPAVKPPKLPLYSTALFELPLVYNPAKMAKPTSWNDLWKPGITVGVPHISNSYGIIFLYIAALINGGSVKDLGPGFDALKRIRDMKIYKGVVQGFTMFQRGEIDAALYYDHRAWLLKEQGVNVAWTEPKEGVWGMRTGCQIPKTAPDLELSRDWVDTTLDVPSQTAFAKDLYSPTNRKVPMPPEITAKNIAGAAWVDSLEIPPWSELNPQRDALLTRWTREFKA